jgi:hypothetical protein
MLYISLQYFISGLSKFFLKRQLLLAENKKLGNVFPFMYFLLE